MAGLNSPLAPARVELRLEPALQGASGDCPHRDAVALRCPLQRGAGGFVQIHAEAKRIAPVTLEPLGCACHLDLQMLFRRTAF